MGFRKDAYAYIFDVRPSDSGASTDLRISISKKDKDTGKYVSDFSGFVKCCGSAVAAKAAALKQGDRIKLGDVDCSNKYDKEKKTTTFYFKVFSFELVTNDYTPLEPSEPVTTNVDSGELDDSDAPF